jgi:hypothetical protein
MDSMISVRIIGTSRGGGVGLTGQDEDELSLKMALRRADGDD